MSIFSSPFGGGGGGTPGALFVSPVEVDASLEANLPVGSVNGQTHKISVAGNFQSSALVSPLGFAFEPGDYIRSNGTIWSPVIGNADIDNAAYDATLWDGDILNAPSKNAVRDKLETYLSMANQAHTAVNIDGGTIDNTPIGSAVPAAGTFTTANATTFDTNVAAAGVTLSGTTLEADGTDANIDISITPKGTGEVNLTKVDIDSGTIDNTAIGSAVASTVKATTLESTSARTLAVSSVATTGGTTTGSATDHSIVFTGTLTQTHFLPACATGRELRFKNRSTGAVTLSRAGSDTIDSSLTTLTLAADDSAILVGSTTNWTSFVSRKSLDAAFLAASPAATATNPLATVDYVSTRLPVGTISSRPASPTQGMMYFDIDLGFPIWYNGSAWVNATGGTV